MGSIQTVNRQQELIRRYAASAEEQRKLFRRTLITVIFSQIFGGAGLAAGITVGALLAQDMLGTDNVTGVPTALFTLGSALAALLVGRSSQKHGRRLGLGAGFIAGSLGAIGVIAAAVLNSIVLLLVSLFVYGAGSATNLQARYAGTDLATPKQRATAASMAMVFTTFGAVAGPNLVNITGDFAMSLDIPRLAGPFILAAAAYCIAGIVLLAFLRPDPLIAAKAFAGRSMESDTGPGHTLAASLDRKGLFVGVAVMVMTQIVMVAIMTMTPVHMKHHGHGLSEVGLVIGFHIGSMYLPSLVTGMLADKIGRKRMAAAAGFTLLLSGVAAALAPAESMPMLTVALSLLGLGWNFGLISGTALIIDATTPQNRAKVQGSVDVLIALAGATGGAVSGMVVAHSSYAALSLGGGVLAVLLLPILFWPYSRKHKSE